MKKCCLSVLILSFLIGSIVARDPAHVRLYCTSVRVHPGTAAGSGGTQTFELTTDQSFKEINDELSPPFDPQGYFRLNDPASVDNITGTIALDVPFGGDANANGFADFFEVSQAIADRSDGSFAADVDQGTVAASWSRGAGSATGTCRLQLTGDAFGALPLFTHTFEIIEYIGTLNYVPGSNGVTGVLSVVQTQASSNTLSGSLSLVRIATNRFNALTLKAGSLANAAGKVLTYSSLTEIDRDPVTLTNYYGTLQFADGDPTTSTADYQQWVLSIDDTNDTNGNAIPDFSDDPIPVNIQQPLLNLAKAGGQLLLQITGGVGKPYDLQQAPALGPTNWMTSSTITLTNTSQTISLPLPGTQTMFWRLRAQ